VSYTRIGTSLLPDAAKSAHSITAESVVTLIRVFAHTGDDRIIVIHHHRGKDLPIMNRKLLHTLIVASFATLAFNAGAENATPRELPPGTVTTTPTQNGSPVGTTTTQTGTNQPGVNTAPVGTNSQNMKSRMTAEQMREYMDARNACGSQGAKMETCNTEVNRKFSSVDAKCQKLSGSGLADCLKGADHGG
jgi:hypothetical protein